MANLEPKHRRSRPVRRTSGSRRKPENLVAEIVDQITEKQARAVEKETEKPRKGCDVVLEPAGTPYLAVLSCSNDEPGFP